MDLKQRKEVELKPCPECKHEMLHKRTTKTTVSMPVSIRCGLCDLTIEMQNWGSLVKFWNGLQRPQDNNALVPLDKDQMYMAVIDELKKHHFTDFDAFQMDCTLNTICAKFGKDNSGHDGDCTVYSSMQNNHITDGICTCGYGHRQQTSESFAMDNMYSQERISEGLERKDNSGMDLSDEIAEQKNLIAVERLAGNIVKQELHKGIEMGLRLAQSKLSQQPQKQDNNEFGHSGDKTVSSYPEDNQQPPKERQKIQPCGCVVCSCQDDAQCHGCGAKNCGTKECVFKFHPENIKYKQPPKEQADTCNCHIDDDDGNINYCEKHEPEERKGV